MDCQIQELLSGNFSPFEEILYEAICNRGPHRVPFWDALLLNLVGVSRSTSYCRAFCRPQESMTEPVKIRCIALNSR